MPLSEEDRRDFLEKHFPTLGDISPKAMEAINAAYDLGDRRGVERARVVKPLEWEQTQDTRYKVFASGIHYVIGNYSSSGDDWSYSIDCGLCRAPAASFEEAKAACQAHHAACVLALLVAP